MGLYIGLLMTRLKHTKKFSSWFMKFMKSTDNCGNTRVPKRSVQFCILADG